MKSNLEYSGLCSNCLQAPECSYRANHKGPILFCEEFSYERKVVNTTGHIVASKENEALEGVNGLCINCENRSECSLEKTKTGIVYCNEYSMSRVGEI